MYICFCHTENLSKHQHYQSTRYNYLKEKIYLFDVVVRVHSNNIENNIEKFEKKGG